MNHAKYKNLNNIDIDFTKVPTTLKSMVDFSYDFPIEYHLFVLLVQHMDDNNCVSLKASVDLIRSSMPAGAFGMLDTYLYRLIDTGFISRTPNPDVYIIDKRFVHKHIYGKL